MKLLWTKNTETRRKKTILSHKKHLSKIDNEERLLQFLEKTTKTYIEEEILYTIINHPHANIRTLRRIVELNISLTLAEEIASIQYCDEETLTILWNKYPGGKKTDMRYIIASHPNAPLELLYSWANVQSAGERQAIAENPRTTSKILLKMLEKEQINFVLSSIMKNRNLPPEIAIAYFLEQ